MKRYGRSSLEVAFVSLILACDAGKELYCV